MNIDDISDEAVVSLGLLLAGREYVIGVDSSSLCVVCVDGLARWIGDELDELFACGLVSEVSGSIQVAENAGYWHEKLCKKRRLVK